MKLSTLHVDYWRERQREPQWVATLLDEHARKQRGMFAVNKRRTVSIDSIINANAGGMRRPHDASGLLFILHLARKRDAIAEVLQRVAWSSDLSPSNTARRRAYARKWLRKLNHRTHDWRIHAA